MVLLLHVQAPDKLPSVVEDTLRQPLTCGERVWIMFDVLLGSLGWFLFIGFGSYAFCWFGFESNCWVWQGPLSPVWLLCLLLVWLLGSCWVWQAGVLPRGWPGAPAAHRGL